MPDALSMRGAGGGGGGTANGVIDEPASGGRLDQPDQFDVAVEGQAVDIHPQAQAHQDDDLYAPPSPRPSDDEGRGHHLGGIFGEELISYAERLQRAARAGGYVFDVGQEIVRRRNGSVVDVEKITAISTDRIRISGESRADRWVTAAELAAELEKGRKSGVVLARPAVRYGSVVWDEIEPTRPAGKVDAPFRRSAAPLSPQQARVAAVNEYLQQLQRTRDGVQVQFNEWVRSSVEAKGWNLSTTAKAYYHFVFHGQDLAHPYHATDGDELRSWRERIEQLDRSIALAAKAVENLERGLPIVQGIAADELQHDSTLLRMAEMERRGATLGLDDEIAMDVARMERFEAAGDWLGTLDAYAALQSSYLERVPQVLRTPDGATSMTAAINRMLAQGLIRTPLSMVATAEDLESIRPDIDRYNRWIAEDRGINHAALGDRPYIDVRQVDAETARLMRLEERDGETRDAMLPAGQIARRIAERHHEDEVFKERTAFFRGLGQLVDDPALLTMVLSGYAAGAIGAFSKARLAAAGLQGLPLDAAELVIHGAVFHNVNSLLNLGIARFSHADFSIGGNAHSIAIMWWLGRVQKLFGAAVVPRYAQFLADNPALFRSLTLAGSKSAEVFGLTAFNLGIRAVDPAADPLTAGDIGDELIDSTRFVIAFGALNSARTHGGRSPAERGLELAEGRLRREGEKLRQMRAELEASPSDTLRARIDRQEAATARAAQAALRAHETYLRDCAEKIAAAERTDPNGREEDVARAYEMTRHLVEEEIERTREVRREVEDGLRARHGDVLVAAAELPLAEGLAHFNAELAEFDRVGGAKRRGEELSREDQAILDDPALKAKDAERATFVRARYREHGLASADAPESPTRTHLEAHLNAVDLGSHFDLGEGAVFRDGSQVIQFSEGLLARAYRGELAPGSETAVTVEMGGNMVSGRARVYATGESIGGVDVGPSGTGGRVVIGITFDQPIGREGIAPLAEGQVALAVTRTTGGRQEMARVIDGEKPPTNTMYVVGGPYGPTGRFGLFTVFSGTYAPPMTDTAYWGQHAFLSGESSPSYRAHEDGSVSLREGSTLHRMTEAGRLELSAPQVRALPSLDPPAAAQPFVATARPPAFKGYFGADVVLEDAQAELLLGHAGVAAGAPLVPVAREKLHVTLVGPPEVKAMAERLVREKGLSKSKAQAEAKKILADAFGSLSSGPRVTGVGKATDAEGGHTVFFATVSWPEAQAVRVQLGLAKKDLHITLASTRAAESGEPLDVHGVPKGEPTVVRLGEGGAPEAPLPANPSAAAGPAVAESPVTGDGRAERENGVLPWAERLVERAQSIGDEGLIARATALRDQAAGTGPDDPKALRRALGELNRAVEPRYREVAAARRAAEGDLSAIPFGDIGRFEALRQAGVIDQPMWDDFAAWSASLPGAAEVISERLRGAAGRVQRGDLIAAYTSIRGLHFELSRRASGRNGVDDAAPKRTGVAVDYEGFRVRTVEREGRPAEAEEARPRQASPVLSDVPVADGRHVWEVKSYPRRNAGETVQVRNQALKYQAAIEAGQIDGATIEISGNVDPSFLAFLQQRAPDVEVLYSTRLVDGHEIVFPIKRGMAERSMAPDGPPEGITAAETRIIRGIQRAMELGILGDILANDILTVEDVARSGQPDELRAAVSQESGRVDPTRLTTLDGFKEYERLVHAKRMETFGALFDRPVTHRPFGVFLREVTDEVVGQEFERSQAYIAALRNPVARHTYTLKGAEEEAAVRAEFAIRLQAIAAFESQRLSDGGSAARDERLRLGYTGPSHGYHLDSPHIYMDAIAAVRAARKGAGSKRPKGARGDWGHRSYDVSATFPTAAAVAAEMRAGRNQEARTTATVRYPAGMKEDFAVSREHDLSGTSADPAVRAEEAARNYDGFVARTTEDEFGRLGKMFEAAVKKDSSERDEVERSLAHDANRSALETAHRRYAEKRQEMVAAIDAAKRASSGKRVNIAEVAASYKQDLRRLAQEGMDAYRRALGDVRFDALTIHVGEPKSDIVRKFIYVIDADNTMRLAEESLQPGGERPAHSMLAAGRNVYAAGEVYVRGLTVVSINNGSGHYRPDAAENLDYAMAILARNGFDVSAATTEHQRFPFVDLKDNPIEALWRGDADAPPLSPEPHGREGVDIGLVPAGAADAAALRARMVEGIREELRGRPIHRRLSPYVASEEVIEVTIDLETGAVVRPGGSAPSTATVEYIVDPLRNRARLRPEIEPEIQAILARDGDPKRRAVLQALLDSANVALAPEEQAPRPDRMLPSGRPEVVANMREVTEHNIDFLTRRMTSSVRMTVFLGRGPDGKVDFDAMNFRVGVAFLDASGRIQGLLSRMPIDRSPRGTMYLDGIRTGSAVGIVLHGSDVVWTGDVGLLGSEQGLAIRRLEEAGREKRDRLSRERPGEIERIVERERGNIASAVRDEGAGRFIP